MIAAALLLLAAAVWVAPRGDAALRIDTAASGPKRPRDGPLDRLLALGGRIPLPAGVRRVAQGLTRTPWRRHALDIAADVELYAACVSSGLAPATAVAVVVDATTDRLRGPWRTVASLLAIGVAPERAWAPVDGIPGLDELAVLAKNSHDSGAAVAGAGRRIAAKLRADVINQATADAERAGVLIALPLTVCFLPAFLILGLVPVIASLAGELF